jgi:hypothetical protein
MEVGEMVLDSSGGWTDGEIGVVWMKGKFQFTVSG